MNFVNAEEKRNYMLETPVKNWYVRWRFLRF